MRPSFWLPGLPALAFLLLAAPAQAQTPIFTQTFDGKHRGRGPPGHRHLRQRGNAVTVQNASAATYFPGASSASSVTGGDAGTNYAVFGATAANRLRTTANATLTTGLFTAVYDIYQPSTGTGAGPS